MTLKVSLLKTGDTEAKESLFGSDKCWSPREGGQDGQVGGVHVGEDCQAENVL